MKRKLNFKDIVGDSPRTKVLEFLIENRLSGYTYDEIGYVVSLHPRTVEKYIRVMHRAKMVDMIQFNVFRINQDNEYSKAFISIYDHNLRTRFEEMQEIQQ